MAGEIQLNSTTMATESSGSITAELDTIRPNTTNGSLTLQGDSSDAGVTGLTIDSSGNATFAGTAKSDTIKPKTTDASLTLQGDSSGSGVTGITIDSSGVVNTTTAKVTNIQATSGQSLTIKDEDGNTAITIGTDNTATGYLSLNFGSYHGGSGTLSGNTLDDYEEGTWTPTYTTISGNNEPTHTPDILENHYTKIGRMVHVICLIRTDSVDTNSLSSSENLAVGGLPFQTSERSFLTIDNANGWGTNTQRPEYGKIEAGQTKITLTYSERIDLTSSPFYTNNMINGSNANTTAFSFSYLTNN